MSTLPKTAPYLTLITGRNPYKKTHLSLGQAKKAVLIRLRRDKLDSHCMVYQWNDKVGWCRFWNLPVDTSREDLPWT